MTKTISTILICFLFGPVFGQHTVSQHKVSFYINNTKQHIVASKIKIIVDTFTIIGTKNLDIFSFPIIDSSKEFKIEIEINKLKFLAGPYKAWCLNNGSQMIFGELTKINSLLSVAKYNQMDSTDESWEAYSKRFFIVDKAYTIDIADVRKTKELQFLILAPLSDGDGVYFLTQKVTKTR
jgi:hypothetical protein